MANQSREQRAAVKRARNKRLEERCLCNACGQEPPKPGVNVRGRRHKRCIGCIAASHIDYRKRRDAAALAA